MKKVSLLVLLLFLTVWIVPQALALGTVGFIDVQRVFKEYKATAKAQEQFTKEEETYKKDLEASQKKVEELKKANKDEKELEKMTKELEEKLAPQRQRLLTLNEQLTKKLQEDIIKSCNAISKNLGLEVIVDKQVVIAGGMDITDMVINKLNEKN